LEMVGLKNRSKWHTMPIHTNFEKIHLCAMNDLLCNAMQFKSCLFLEFIM
jgi:hypothetical protein